MTTEPVVENLFLNSGLLKSRTTSWFKRLITLSGVFAGANMTTVAIAS